jgi:hypothetical protein
MTGLLFIELIFKKIFLSRNFEKCFAFAFVCPSQKSCNEFSFITKPMKLNDYLDCNF